MHVDRLLVRRRRVLDPPLVVEEDVLGADRRVIETGRDRPAVRHLAVLVLHEVGHRAVEDAGAAAGQWRRVVIEKPFGHDLDSAKALNRDIKAVLAENQIYRIDHYLGKETVQNIMVFRFDNAIFEPIWNRRYVDHVQITNAETVGVEQRVLQQHRDVGLLARHEIALAVTDADAPQAAKDAYLVPDERTVPSVL